MFTGETKKMGATTVHHFSLDSLRTRRRERFGGGKGRRKEGVGESDAKDEDADRLSAPSISCNPLLCPLEADGESSSLGWVAFWCKSHARLMRSVLRICGPISAVFPMADDNMLGFFLFSLLSTDPFFQDDHLCWFICLRPKVRTGKMKVQLKCKFIRVVCTHASNLFSLLA